MSFRFIDFKNKMAWVWATLNFTVDIEIKTLPEIEKQLCFNVHFKKLDFFNFFCILFE